MNNVQLIGRLTKDIEVKQTSSGASVATFNIAVNRNYVNQNGEREADFISCIIWRKGAENLARFARKGSQVGLDGRLQTRNYENSKGQRVYITELVVDNFYLLETKKETEGRSQGQSFYNDFPQGQPVNISDDDLPF